MPVDPADYPETTRGYPYPTLINPGGAEANAATDVPADLKRLADAVDADVTAVEAAAGIASGTVASDLAAHVADTTAVHGIADTSVLVTTARTITAGTGLTGGGTLAADRTLTVAYGSTAGTAAQGNDARLSDTRTPTDNTVTTAKIAAGAVGTTELANDAVTTGKIAAGAVGTTDLADDAVTTAKIAAGTIVDSDISGTAAIAKTKIAGTAVTVADTGTVTDAMLAGSITPSKVTGTALVASLADAKGDLFVGTAADTVARVPVGNNGDLLVASSGATPGLAWRAPSPITVSATGVTLDRANPVYTFTSGSVTATLPTPATHTGVRFLIRNTGTDTVTVSGITGLTIPGTGYVDVVSDGSAWVVLDGAYSTSAVGLASYRWNQATSAWRLVAYDSGVRNIAGALLNGWTGTNNRVTVRRVLHTVYLGLGDLDGRTATDPLLWSAPSGFANDWYTVAPAYQPSTATTVASVQVIGGDVRWYGTYPVYHDAYLSWATDNPLPTSLPGTQITAPV